jgi:hypothetical protein
LKSGQAEQPNLKKCDTIVPVEEGVTGMSEDNGKLVWNTEKRKISDLIPHATNPRYMTERQIEDLKNSLEKFNLAEIPAINQDNTILAGHQRIKVMALIGRGEEEVEVRVPNRLLTAEEAKEYLIRSNRNTGEWDWDVLAANFTPMDLTTWGFEKWEIPEMKTPELTAPTGVIFGDGTERTFSPDNINELEAQKPFTAICPQCGHEFPVKRSKDMDLGRREYFTRPQTDADPA